MGNSVATDNPCYVPHAMQMARMQHNNKAKEQSSISHVCNGVVNPTTGETITKYKTLINDPATRSTWLSAMFTELGRLSQGWENTKGTNTVTFMDTRDITTIPKNRIITYTRIVVDYRLHKEDPNRVCITAGGDLKTYPHELTTRTADLTKTKVLWNSTISTPDDRYMCIDIKNMYLATPMDRFEYRKKEVNLIPTKYIDKYNLHQKIKKLFCLYANRTRYVWASTIRHSSKQATQKEALTPRIF